MNYTPVSLAEKDTYLKLWQKTPQRSLDYTLANLWGWGPYFGLEWNFDGELCRLRQTVPAPVQWAPIGDWKSIDWTKEELTAKGGTFIRVPEELARIWAEALGDRAEITEARGHWEYLYNQQDLATLAGKKFHKKKNHVNAYIKEYGEPDYRPLNTGEAIEDVLSLQDEWCQWHECQGSNSLQAENEAINRVLAHWEAIPGLVGGALYAEGNIAAFSIGEKLDDENLGVHYEKGRTSVRGVYQTINRCFSSHDGNGFRYLNRAQDLDEEGLRQAKMTYQPAGFLQKYTVRIAPADK